MSSDSDSATVLVVDDESEVADAYAFRLRQHYNVLTAYGGEEALDTIDETVDVVLLDRRMPVSGDEVLDEIRDRGLDCRVIMVTAVDPDFDIVEMPFDDYLCKPIDADDLLDAIEQQLNATQYDDRLSELFSLTSKIAVLESEKTPEQLQRMDEYTRMKDRVQTLRSELNRMEADFTSMTDAFNEINRTGR